MIQYAKSIARLLHAQVAGGSNAVALLKSQYGLNEPALGHFQKAVGNDAIPSTWTAATAGFLQLVNQRSLLGKIGGFRVMPPETSILKQETTIDAQWIGEAAAAAVSEDFSLAETVRLKPRKLVHIIALTAELLRRGGTDFEQSVTQSLVHAEAKAENTAFLDPDNAGSDEKPASILHSVEPVASTEDAKAAFGALCDAFTRDLSTAVLLTSPRDGIALHGAGFEGAGAQGGDVAGVRLVTADEIPTGQRILLDPSMVGVADEGIDVAVSTEAGLNTESGVLPLLQMNLAAVRVTRRIDWLRLDDSAVVWIAAE